MKGKMVRGRAGKAGRDRAAALRALLAREAAGLPINSNAVRRDDPRLYDRTIRLFGSWDAGLRAGGIEPARVRMRQRWTSQAVIQRIQERADRNEPLNYGAVSVSDCGLVAAASRRFGSWNHALKAAGLDPIVCRKRAPAWTPERVLETVRGIDREGGRLNWTALGLGGLLTAAVRSFGSWDQTLRAAGLDPDEIRRHRKPWTPDDLLDEIRRKHRAGEALNAQRLSPASMYHAARVFFGSWDAALAAAGLDPNKIRKSRRPG